MSAREIPAAFELLNQVTDADVLEWLRDAWPDREIYPNVVLNCNLAGRINTIVDRANARVHKDDYRKALDKRRRQYKDARRAGRTLNRLLQPVLASLTYEKEFLNGVYFDARENDALTSQIDATEGTLQALSDFLARCGLPSTQDHQDPIIWIAEAAKEAWENTAVGSSKKTTERKVKFGRHPGGSLVIFIRLALEGIGLAAEGRQGYGPETISDHLRGRQNRTGKRQRADKGAKRSTLRPVTEF